eukprot:Pgem_evm1s12918
MDAGNPCVQALVFTYRARAGYDLSEEECKKLYNSKYEIENTDCTYDEVSTHTFDKNSLKLVSWIHLTKPAITHQIRYRYTA